MESSVEMTAQDFMDEIEKLYAAGDFAGVLKFLEDHWYSVKDKLSPKQYGRVAGEIGEVSRMALPV